MTAGAAIAGEVIVVGAPVGGVVVGRVVVVGVPTVVVVGFAAWVVWVTSVGGVVGSVLTAARFEAGDEHAATKTASVATKPDRRLRTIICSHLPIAPWQIVVADAPRRGSGSVMTATHQRRTCRWCDATGHGAVASAG